MNCPSCKTYLLQPKQIEYGLPALICSKCGGCQIDLLTYRLWRETKKNTSAPTNTPIKESIDTQNAISCPKCKSLMTKYRIKEGLENRIDLCGSCGEVWLDGGEWQLLESLNLNKEVPAILSAPWQSAIKHKEITAQLEKSYIAELGEKDFAKIKEIRQWLASHPKSDIVKQLLFRLDDI